MPEMTNQELIRLRLYNQGISQSPFERAEDVVAWLGAVQAQDYPAAKWAVAQRTRTPSNAALDEALDSGKILRLHVLRPTWHFVAPADVRWMLALTSPRVNAANATYYRRLELDEALFRHSNAVLEKALRDGRQLTRAELVAALTVAGVTAGDPLRFTLLVMRAELDGVICSGGLRSKQHTFALLDERVPETRKLEPDEALAELTWRYFRSRGPATLKDFCWWSSLTMMDAKTGLETIKSRLVREEWQGREYWRPAEATPKGESFASLYLLSNYDEYVVGYTDRSAIYNPAHNDKLDARGNPLFNNTIALDGRIVGTWRRTIKKDEVILSPTPFHEFSPAERQAFASAARRYGEFLGKAVSE